MTQAAHRTSESRGEAAARDLLAIRGWNLAHPPKGNLLWKNEYRDYPELNAPLQRASKSGDSYGVPDFIVVSRQTLEPLIVGEVKARPEDISTAAKEAASYAEAFTAEGIPILVAGVAGNTDEGLAVRISKWSSAGWKPIEYREQPIEWIPTPDEAERLIHDQQLFRLDPQVPPAEVLAANADEINRVLRESRIKDELRPAVIGAFMLGMWKARGNIRTSPEYVLTDINSACRRAFEDAGKYEIADSILVPIANERLAARAPQIIRILRLLNITTLTAAHDYLGQLYETFFRFTGGNTIGQFFTPRHITAFMADLCRVTENDYVLDPTCGTGGFLISSLYRMMGDRNLDRNQLQALVADHLVGFESEPITAALCVANMILRGDGTTGVAKGDAFSDDRFPTGKATVVMGNPPFPHRNTDDPTEKFVDRSLEALQTRGTLAMIVPGSLLVKRAARNWRNSLLKSNTLRAVITLPTELFQPYASATTAILMLERGVPHESTANVFFAHIQNDGFRLRKGVRLRQSEGDLGTAIDAFNSHKSIPGLCIWTQVLETEWAPGAYIESIPFDNAVLELTAAYLARSIASSQILYLEECRALTHAVINEDVVAQPYQRQRMSLLGERNNPDSIASLFDVVYGQSALETKVSLARGLVPVISSAGSDNGIHGFYEMPNGTDPIQPPFVTVPRTGSIGESFVQLLPCGATSDCLLLLPKDGTDLTDLFIAAATIRLEKWRFNYGRKITPSRVAGFVLNRSGPVKECVQRRIQNVVEETNNSIALTATDGIVAQFNKLAQLWESERPYGVDVGEMVMHVAYQRIIGLGPSVIPLVLSRLEKQPAHWFWALHVLTGADPVTPEHRGRISDMAADWVEWGKARGYRW